MSLDPNWTRSPTGDLDLMRMFGPHGPGQAASAGAPRPAPVPALQDHIPEDMGMDRLYTFLFLFRKLP